ncbi:hypothetical protein BU24DRAFT_484169 [Aaosphaeria arxii CBS 175.79]|uniref:Zn(2)-C6 fungal-type domain-containing protein n=1 Tax=Aaosphaeria arxii CBS 175.79 TaxID=1450172 RepID=A0A6A5XHT5_9PLEO|nr:uncharacterized protein BU24DRAFT_484169 [Aaosphaeria arxii CBS 175.79]KAF2012513.1 hypothetical protein BU24DRAFT_484169 [Aaosphaeria arxii CBS 175.79]
MAPEPLPAETIVEWLQKIDLDSASTVTPERDDIDTALEEAPRPNTPAPTVVVVEPEEVSPTKTNFSGDTVFDEPPAPALYKGYVYGEPGRKDDINIDEIRSASSITDAGDYDLQSSSGDDEASAEIKAPEDVSCAGLHHSLTGFYAATEQEVSATSEKTEAPEKRLVIVVSCLQCTLQGMRCSRTLPACSRCVRAGRDDTCLLHRRMMAYEAKTNGQWASNMPILLRLQHDPEEKWNMKNKLAQKLLQEWRIEQDRKNWVLPNPYNGKILKQTRRYGTPFLRKTHPGEGQGNVGDGIRGHWLNLA